MNFLGHTRTRLRVQSIGAACATAVLIAACGVPEPGPDSSSTNSVSSSSSSIVTSSSSSSSSSQGHAHAETFQDHCIVGFEPHETDGMLPDTYAEYTENGQTDTTLRPEIIKWMEDHSWQESHFLWHGARRCIGGGGGFGGFGGGSQVDPCSFADMRPEENECAGPQDGYEFLVMHRHMIHTLKQLWPSMEDHFAGWDTFPDREDYPAVLHPYFREWNSQVRQEAARADNIDQMTREEVLAQWPTEGHFGQWIQCGTTQGGLGLNGLHGALHFNGHPPQNQTHSVANQRRNLDAYQFWKLHGWIDTVWEKYRTAVGLTPEDDGLQAELLKQCQEHHFWAEQLDPNLADLD